MKTSNRIGKWNLVYKQPYSKLSNTIIGLFADLTGSLIYVPDYTVEQIINLVEPEIKRFEPTNKRALQGYNLFARLVENEYIEIINDKPRGFVLIAEIRFTESA